MGLRMSMEAPLGSKKWSLGLTLWVFWRTMAPKFTDWVNQTMLISSEPLAELSSGL